MSYKRPGIEPDSIICQIYGDKQVILSCKVMRHDWSLPKIYAIWCTYGEIIIRYNDEQISIIQKSQASGTKLPQRTFTFDLEIWPLLMIAS